MKTAQHNRPNSTRRQQGATLIVGLIFLVVLTMIGVTAARMSSLEERMAGNMRDRALAMEAAELALRDAEQDILGQGAAPRNPPISGISGFTADCGESTAVANDNGLCYNGIAGYVSPVWTVANMTNASRSVAYGQFTGAANIPRVSAQPRYIIEGMEKYCWLQCEGSKTPGYRITVRAQGANPNTVVWLQEIFKP